MQQQLTKISNSSEGWNESCLVVAPLSLVIPQALYGDNEMPKAVKNARLNQINKILSKYQMLLQVVKDPEQVVEIQESYDKYKKLYEKTQML